MTAPIVKQLLAAYPAQVRFAFKHYPLPMHKESPLAHEASLAAADQGKFWEMHDALFAETAGTERQNAGTDETAGTDTTVHAAQKARLGTVVSVPFSRDDLIAKAAQLHLDIARFTKDLDTHRFKPQVDQDRQEGNRLGVDGTPFFFINGHAISGGASLQDFKHLIDAALKKPPPPRKARNRPMKGPQRSFRTARTAQPPPSLFAVKAGAPMVGATQTSER